MVDKLRYILHHFNWRRLGVVSLADTLGENCQSAVIDTAKRIPDFEQLDAVLVSSSILSRDTAKRDEHIENLKKGLQELKAKNQRIICFCGSTGDFQVVYNTARALDMVNEEYVIGGEQ
ncbi:hypothetical protein SARC_13808 [Sphaeroforma arctica JP610]|uniref:Receptor ligand binding region domain-containing protein n=1 Tax=Sphaeroforma arctica JP610 TaxID=667725 RepID=A0A0L0FC33_9EUKA|nr:hypothetical protein SARC_13808 [Sphaeroforma arctica JP610]KNC73633.1 hypothetical protein SARC_13808 [Sphaeroforma arctica JP610]|eukprot:XP_014147535.1 hypothetical protein SARC_13808 [Sphaeroforma arctica JP610]